MSANFRKLEIYLWSVVPALVTIFLLIVYLMPKHISGLGNIMPLLPLMSIFYWGLRYAAFMPYWFVFLLGVVSDSLTGMPIGISSVLYMIFLLVLHAQHKYIYKEGFIIIW